jgi:hypothetical protein
MDDPQQQQQPAASSAGSGQPQPQEQGREPQQRPPAAGGQTPAAAATDDNKAAASTAVLAGEQTPPSGAEAVAPVDAAAADAASTSQGQQQQAARAAASSDAAPAQQQPPPPQQQQQHRQPQQQQQQASSWDSGGSVLDSRGSNKPKLAGNLFDVVKSEMMQLKLDNGKLTKRVEGLSKRGSASETATAALQQQAATLAAQLERLTKKVDALASSHATATAAAQALRKEVNALLAARESAGAGGVGDGAGRMHGMHPHPAHLDAHLVPAAASLLGAAGHTLLPPVCARPGIVGVQLLLQPRYQWGVVAALASTSMLGLWLVLHPKRAGLPQLLRLVVCVLALLNGILAVLLGLWLLVMQGLAFAHHASVHHFVHHQQQQHGPAQQPAVVFMGSGVTLDGGVLAVPPVPMLGNGSEWPAAAAGAAAPL